ncbi:MAG: AAA family ATPase [Bacteroidota bacterium]
MIDRLYGISASLAANVPVGFERYLSNEIDENAKLTGISGARGCGKTILLLQLLKKKLQKGKNALYISLDDIYFANNKFVYYSEEFARNGGEWLFVDEVHKYKNWSQELKSIYDSIPHMNVVFTSSSALEINKGSHDLSRRALVYKLKGLSLREYIELKYNIKFSSFRLGDILSNHEEIAREINSKVKIFPYFNEYLQTGYYPFFIETGKNYLAQLLNTINTVIESDIPAINEIDFNSAIKLKKLLTVVSQIVPFTPNIEKLAKQIETTRPTLLKYLYYLDKAEIISWIVKDSHGINYLNKPDKLFLNNTNLAWALSSEKPDAGSIRETFFYNQLSYKHLLTYPEKGDFLIDGKYIFEIGGKNKKKTQIAGLSNAYIAADDMEYGYQNKIPLWIFGFLY